MPFIPTATVARCDLAYDWDSQHVENSLWFRSDGPEYEAGRLELLATGVNSWATDNLMPLLSEELVYRGCIAYAQFAEDAPAVNVSVEPTAGGSASGAVPNNVAWCVKFNTDARGRSGRGRNYVPGLPLDQVAQSAILAPFAASLLVVYNALLTFPALDGFTWVVVSHFTAGAPRAAGLAQQVINASYSDLTLDSQRRRLPGRGT